MHDDTERFNLTAQQSWYSVEFREAVANSLSCLILTSEVRRAEYAIAKSDEYTEWFPKGNYGYPTN